MNIGIFIQAYLPKMGGAQISTHCLANSLVDLGHRVTVFTERKHVDECSTHGWEFKYEMIGIRIPKQKISKISTKLWVSMLTWVLGRSVSKFKIDIIQIINAWPWIAIDLKKQRSFPPILLRAVGDDIQVNNKLNYGIGRDSKLREVISGGYQGVQRTIANSITTRQEYLKLGISSEKIELITPGVDLGLFESVEVDPRSVKEKHSLPQDLKIVLAVGRNHLKKGYSQLIEALKHLNAEVDEYCVVIVGKNTTILNDEAKKIGQKQNFYAIEEISSVHESDLTRFPSPELVELYKCADIFILPSILETFGNVKLEAMAAGTPVIVTDAPGARDAVIHNENGLIVPLNSPEEIASAVIRIDKSQELRNKLIKNGFSTARAQDWLNVAKKYESLYKELQDSEIN